MKLIEKTKNKLINAGFSLKEDSFNDKSSRWIQIFRTPKALHKRKSIGAIHFNWAGTKIVEVTFHHKNEKAAWISINQTK